MPSSRSKPGDTILLLNIAMPNPRIISIVPAIFIYQSSSQPYDSPVFQFAVSPF